MGRLSIINMSNFPKLRGKFTVIQIEIPTGFLKVEKKKFNIHLEVFKSENAKNIFFTRKREDHYLQKMYQRSLFENTGVAIGICRCVSEEYVMF